MAIIAHPNINHEFYFDVTNNVMPGQYTGQNSTGYQTANSTGVEADIWGGVVGNLAWLQTASILEVVSSNANDTAAGTGARTCFIQGLDSSLNTISETVTLNGTTPVQTVNTYFRVNRGFTPTNGTYGGANIGNITIRVTGGGSTQAYIPAADGRIAMTHFTVPAGKKFLLRSVDMVSESTKPTTFKVYIKQSTPTTAPYGTKQLGLVYSGISGGFTEHFIHITPLIAGIDIWATATPSANNSALSFTLQGVTVSV